MDRDIVDLVHRPVSVGETTLHTVLRVQGVSRQVAVHLEGQHIARAYL